MIGFGGSLVGWEQKLLASALIALACLAVVYGVYRIRRRLVRRYSAITLDVIASTVIAAMVILAGLVVSEIWGQTDVIVEELGFLRVDERAPEVVITVVILIAIQVFSGIVRRLLDDLADESESITDHQREVGTRLSQLAFWGVGLIVILGVWNIDLTGILVGAGFLGIVIGLAARKTIGSLIAGLVLMFSRPFEVGDWVVVDGQEGVVTDITLMSTRVRSFNGDRVVVPNDVITGEIVINRSREGRLRVEAEVGIDYEDDLRTAVEVAESVVTDVAREHSHGLEEPSPGVLVQSFGDSAIELAVRVWLDAPNPPEIRAVQHELIEALKTAFDEHDLTIPYPQRELSARDGTFGQQPVGRSEPLQE